MELQAEESMPSERRYTIGTAFTRPGVPGVAVGEMEEDGGLGPSRSTGLAQEELANVTEGGLRFSANEPPDPNPAVSDDLSSADAMRETQRLLLWSAAPGALGAPSGTDSTEGEPPTSPPTSPSEALLHSLGDTGLRSAMRPPAFLPQQDWLRHLLLQTIEDAQLLFSSLWDDCSCVTLGLPGKTCPDTTATSVLDPAIAFAASGPSAPKRRLPARSRGALSPKADEQAHGFAGAHILTEEHQEGGRTNEADESAEGERDANGEAAGARAPPTAREYISAAMSWAVRQLDNPSVYPPSPTTAGSGEEDTGAEKDEETLRVTASLIVRRLLRCYAHVYLWHLPLLQQHGAVGHANRCLKRLMFLAVDAQLLDGSAGPLKPVRSLAEAWLQHDQEHPSEGTPKAGSNVQRPPAAQADETRPDDWLVPALRKAEECLGALDREEYPSFGATGGTEEENSHCS